MNHPAADAAHERGEHEREERVEGARPAAERSESEAAEHVRELFSSIAPTYDRANHLLSCGLDRRWWRRAAVTFREVLARPDARVLDICCGTGDLTAALLAETARSVVTAESDPERMVIEAQRGSARVHLVNPRYDRIGDAVCVSLLPAMNADICQFAPASWKATCRARWMPTGSPRCMCR